MNDLFAPKITMTQVAKPKTQEEYLISAAIKRNLDQQILDVSHAIWARAPQSYRTEQLRRAKGE